ncbi:TraR/DksA C4-type zinc finger protein [candidate division KSB1 bacterium]|nr:TraR/DksA C4-type zinc finger protein [candidate division KSB1 bacterium]
MKSQDLQYFKRLLLERRAELLKELDHFKNGQGGATVKDASGENTSYAHHMADQGTDNMEREKAYYFATREGRLLYHIDQALERVEDGSYGHCHNCNQLIAWERLEAVPHARLCINCKMKEESGVSLDQ